MKTLSLLELLEQEKECVFTIKYSSDCIAEYINKAEEEKNEKEIYWRIAQDYEKMREEASNKLKKLKMQIRKYFFELITEEEADNESDYSNMKPCDFSGLCVGWNCSNYMKCKGK